jgi:hypothetical protein
MGATVKAAVSGQKPRQEESAMRSTTAIVALAALAAIACQKSAGPVTPTAPEEPGPEASVTTCPCWDAATIGIAFPAVHFFQDADGTAALTRFDLANAQQIQALVRLTTDGQGSCELASFGTGGLVEALASASELTPDQCEACSALLEGPAATFGFGVQPVEGETGE